MAVPQCDEWGGSTGLRDDSFWYQLTGGSLSKVAVVIIPPSPHLTSSFHFSLSFLLVISITFSLLLLLCSSWALGRYSSPSTPLRPFPVAALPGLLPARCNDRAIVPVVITFFHCSSSPLFFSLFLFSPSTGFVFHCYSNCVTEQFIPRCLDWNTSRLI